MADQSDDAAKQICEGHLDLTGTALMSGDFGSFASAFHLPQHLAMDGKKVLISTRSELKSVFDNMHAHFKSMGVTELLRFIEAASFTSPTRITATHVIRNGQRLDAPDPVYSVIEKIDGNWLIVSGDHALDEKSGQGRALMSAGKSTLLDDGLSDTEN
ncbi:MAG: hypothetical protein P8Q26_10400 [Ascidiaceihabitans sp.]|nr:hypothetical protein [Ascidiaceihabitans sp.]